MSIGQARAGQPLSPIEGSLARQLHGADAWLGLASRSVRILAAATPENLIEERARLTVALTRGARAVPAWHYTRAAPARGGEATRLRPVLEGLASALENLDEPLTLLYAARARELALECAMCEAVGTPVFSALARARFEEADDRGLRFARDLLAKDLQQERDRRAAPDCRPAPTEGALRTDDPSPRSLMSRLRAELGKHRAPFAVRAVRGLSALAATGERHVLVAEGRYASTEDVERTVVHEVAGHVLPRVRAETERLAIFRFGTAKGSCDQEGYALLLEERGGFLGRERLRELCARRVTVEHASAGASYEEAARLLVDVHGFTFEEAARVAERAFRGGTGSAAGLVRDRPYLGAWLRLREAFQSEDDGAALEDVVSRGQVSLAAARILRPMRDDPAARAPR